MSRTWSSTRLLNLVQASRHPAPDWAFFRELSDATGARKERTLDAWAMHTWPSKGYRTVAYEAKVSRSDFARELADPTKRAAAEEVAGECWFITPAGLLRADEVPEGWGLVEGREDGTLVTRKHPLQRPPPALSIAFMASVARRSADAKVDPVVAELFGRPLRLDDLRRLVVAHNGRTVEGMRGRPVDYEAERRGLREKETENRRARLDYIEAELQQALGWGATRSREELRRRLAALAASKVALGDNQLHQAREAIRRLGDWLNLDVTPRGPP